jgi:hypothetical protein
LVPASSAQLRVKFGSSLSKFFPVVVLARIWCPAMLHLIRVCHFYVVL